MFLYKDRVPGRSFSKNSVHVGVVDSHLFGVGVGAAGVAASVCTTTTTIATTITITTTITTPQRSLVDPVLVETPQQGFDSRGASLFVVGNPA